MKALLETKKLSVYYPIIGGLLRRVRSYLRATQEVSLEIHPGEILALVGESGCGKSSFGMACLGLTPATSGKIILNGEEINYKKKNAFNKFRKDFQVIFQDPYLALNPRHTLYEILAEVLVCHSITSSKELNAKIAILLEKVGLNPDQMHRYPHAFSGGQRQRICIARAIALEPKLIICDEIVSALDISVQAQIVQLLLQLKEEYKLALLWISHDLSLVRNISDRVAVMYLGHILEMGECSEIFTNSAHPYTKALLDAIPTLDPSKKPSVLAGEPPAINEEKSSCVFHSRCPKVQAKCKIQSPKLESKATKPNSATHDFACFYPINKSG